MGLSYGAMILLTRKPTQEEIQARIDYLLAHPKTNDSRFPPYMDNCHGTTIYLLDCQKEIAQIMETTPNTITPFYFKKKNYLEPIIMAKFLEDYTYSESHPAFGDIASLSSDGILLHTGIYIRLNCIFNKMNRSRDCRYVSMSEYENYILQRYTLKSKEEFNWRFHRLR
jgi:hypothetical protein